MSEIIISTEVLDGIVLPNVKPFLLLSLAITVDFVLGVGKSRLKKIEVTSHGYRESFLKILQYVGVMLLVFIALNLAEMSSEKVPDVALQFLGDGLIVAMVIAEMLSILENLIDILPNSKITPYLRWGQDLLTLKFLENLKQFRDEETENTDSHTTD